MNVRQLIVMSSASPNVCRLLFNPGRDGLDMFGQTRKKPTDDRMSDSSATLSACWGLLMACCDT